MSKSYYNLKNLFIALSLSLPFTGKLAAQVTTSPSPALDNRLLTITFDATKGNQKLKDYTGKVFAYTAAGTLHEGNWKYFKTPSWGDTSVALTRDADNVNLYHLVIGNPKAFYGIPDTATMINMSLLFYNKDQSLVGRGPVDSDHADGADIYVSVTGGGAITIPSGAVVFSDPALPQPGGAANIYFNAAGGNQKLKDFAGKVFAYTAAGTVHGGNWKYFKTSTWGDTTVALTRDSQNANLYSLFVPNLNEFYGIPDTAQMANISILFYNKDQSLVGRGPVDTDHADGADLFLMVATTTSAVTAVANPTSPGDFVVYPNPSTGTLYLENASADTQVLNITTGNVASYTLARESGKWKLDVKDKGLFIVKSGNQYKKIIVN